jgi:hypothetical protein
MFFKRFARIMWVCVILLSAGTTVRTAHASQYVDPSTLNPPPPPQFNPVCYVAGAGIICNINFTVPEDGGGTGVMCGSGADSFEIMGTSDVKSVNGHRYYDQNLNLVERNYQEVFTGGTLYNPKTGAYLNTYQRDRVLHKLTIPGDNSSGNLHISGVNQFSLPKGGTILLDVGLEILTAGDESSLFESPHHSLYEYFALGNASAIQPICDALMK